MTKQWRLITHDSLDGQINGAILPSFSTLSCYSCILYHSGLNLLAFPTTHPSQFGIKEMLVEANGQNDQIMMTLTKKETKYRFLLCSLVFGVYPPHRTPQVRSLHVAVDKAVWSERIRVWASIIACHFFLLGWADKLLQAEESLGVLQLQILTL